VAGILTRLPFKCHRLAQRQPECLSHSWTMQSPKASSMYESCITTSAIFLTVLRLYSLCSCVEAIGYRGSNANASCLKNSNSSNPCPQDHCHFTMHLDPELVLCCGKVLQHAVLHNSAHYFLCVVERNDYRCVWCRCTDYFALGGLMQHLRQAHTRFSFTCEVSLVLCRLRSLHGCQTLPDGAYIWSVRS
jgi:hypothetical protein